MQACPLFFALPSTPKGFNQDNLQQEGFNLLARIAFACPHGDLRLFSPSGAPPDWALDALASALTRAFSKAFCTLEHDLPSRHTLPELEAAPLFLFPYNSVDEQLHQLEQNLRSQGLAVLSMADFYHLDTPADAFVEKVVDLAWNTPKRVDFAAKCNHQQGLPPLFAQVRVEVSRPDGGLRSVLTPGLDLGEQVGSYFGMHRNGWDYAVKALSSLHKTNATYFESFIEKRFSWGDWVDDRQPALTRPWIGIFHVPLSVPPWFSQKNCFLQLAQSTRWKQSAPYCQGFFTLSHWLKDQLLALPDLAHLPAVVLRYPVQTVVQQWQPQAFLENPRPALLQVGNTYRSLHALHMLPLSLERMDKIILRGAHPEAYHSLYCEEEKHLREWGEYAVQPQNLARFVDYAKPEEYDCMLSSNIVFCYYYTASASTTVVECMGRNTPILVNPLPAIVEYLGKDYPFYYHSWEEAAQKAQDTALVLESHSYLQNMDKNPFSAQSFLADILQSPVYKGLFA